MNAALAATPTRRDQDARITIAAHCPVVMSCGTQWHDMEGTPVRNLDEVTEALQYLEDQANVLRGFRVVRSPIYPSLVRFEDTAREAVR